MYYLDSGFVKVYSISDSGDEFLHVIYGKGELFPLVWAYTGIPVKSLYFETISTSKLWRLPRELFVRTMAKDNALCLALGTQLARQFQVYSDRLDNLEYKKASERIAYRILFLASRFGKKSADGITVEVPISHEIVANSVNLARESVSRELEKLEQANIIGLNSRRRLVIKDVDALVRRLSEPASFKSWNLL